MVSPGLGQEPVRRKKKKKRLLGPPSEAYGDNIDLS